MTDTQADGGARDVPSRFSVDFAGQTLLSTYRVERKLAEGGMGTVYLGEDTNLGRQVVVKVPHARFLGEPGFRARFKREVTELVRLEHPNICRILAQGDNEELPYFVLQYLGGGSLEERLKAAGGSVSSHDALPWLRTIAKTLDFIHARGIIHRDVKPDNILFDEGGHVFLSDFGVVKALEHDDHALTQAGTGIGSPKYMAPEQGIGRAVTGTADQYALASTVYEALAGVAPYVADSAVELLMRKDREEAPHLADVVPTVSRESADAVMRALACDPTDRFETCEAFAEAFAAGLDTGDRTPAAGIRAGGGATAGPGRLVPALVLAVAVVFVSMGFGLAWFGNNGKSTEPVVDDSPYRVKLVNPGKEPRRVLRYQRRAGTTETMAVRSDTRILIMSGGEERAFPHAPYSATFKIRVDEVAANGDVLATAEMIGGDVETVTPYEKHADDARNWMKATVGVKGTMRISARGLPSALTWTNRDNVPEAAESTLTGVEASVQELATPLPEEPVGVGAVWDVTHEGELMGIRYTQTTSYELVSLEENGGRVRIAVAQTAPRQEYRSPALPGGRAMLETWFCHGKGEAVFALDRLVSEPAALEVIVDATHTFSIPNLKTPITQPFHVDVKMKVESR